MIHSVAKVFITFQGAFTGAVLGIVINLWIGIGAIVYKPFYEKKIISVDSCIELFENATNTKYDRDTFQEYYSSPKLFSRKLVD